MRPVPWMYVSSWKCHACGECCRKYTVNISCSEGLQLIKRFGFESARPGWTEFYLKKRPDGRCVFQYQIMKSHWPCGLQHMKPKICKLWPFKIRMKPKGEAPEKALYILEGTRYYVYIDPDCNGIAWGNPSNDLIYKTIPEIIRIASKQVTKRTYSTSHSLIIQPQIYPQ